MSCDLKEEREVVSRMDCGRDFQRRGAARLKARDLIEDKRKGGVVRSMEEEDWRFLEGVDVKEIREVLRWEVMKSLEGEKENLVIYAVFDG